MGGPDPVTESYDAVAQRYAEEIAGELEHKPVERALYACFAELVGAGARVGDVGCGPGHVTRHLAHLGLDPVGLDPSPAMVAVARARHPGVEVRVGSFEDLGEPPGAWAGAVAAYSLIHLDARGRAAAFAGLARVLAPDGWLLASFHVSMEGQAAGSTKRVEEWWGHDVDLAFHFLDPAVVERELADAGFTVVVRTERDPWPGVEAASRRAHLLARLDR